MGTDVEKHRSNRGYLLAQAEEYDQAYPVSVHRQTDRQLVLGETHKGEIDSITITCESENTSLTRFTQKLYFSIQHLYHLHFFI